MWIYFPTSPSARAAADSTEEFTPLSSEQAALLAASCTASGKHSPPRIWSQRWQRGGWIRRLSGAIAPQCPQEFEGAFGDWLDGILSASSAGSPASRSAAPESSKASKTSAGSGPQSSSSWPIAEWDGAALKTFPASLDPAEAVANAYAAGLFDGEGSVTIQSSSRRSVGHTYAVEVRIGMSDKGLPALQLMKDRFGGSLRKSRKKTDRWADAWTWRIGGAPSLPYLNAIAPFVILKREHIAVAVELAKLVANRKGRVWSAQERAKAAAFKSRINRLNLKGPSDPTAEVPPLAILVAGEWMSPQEDLFLGSQRYSETWPRSGGVSNGRLYERPPLALPIVESECSSSEYPTPSATPYGSNQGGQNPGPARPSLETWARDEWPTPQAFDAKDCDRSPEALARAKLIGGCSNLREIAGEWSTPRATDGEKGGPGQTVPLCAQAGEWPTPSTRDGARQSPAELERNTPGLGAVAAGSEWPTPTSGDYKASGSRNTEGSKAHAGVSLSDMVATGDSTSGRAQGAKGRLNWRFVAWLMGWRWLIGETPRPWPPGPDDAEAWAEVLEERPDLAPATADPEPDRAAMLRLLGNGVVPEQAETAVGALLRRVVDMWSPAPTSALCADRASGSVCLVRPRGFEPLAYSSGDCRNRIIPHHFD